MTSQGHQNMILVFSGKEVRAADEARTLEQARSAEAAMAGEGRSHEAGWLGVGAGCDLGLLFVRRREERMTEERALLGFIIRYLIKEQNKELKLRVSMASHFPYLGGNGTK
uniref:Uncharacterized protein n=1 Tax=Oryza rufipogon TaxID=4529 RepID=A0A0E0NTP0_ORYRU